jgi:hypothetical protein
MSEEQTSGELMRIPIFIVNWQTVFCKKKKINTGDETWNFHYDPDRK